MVGSGSRVRVSFPAPYRKTEDRGQCAEKDCGEAATIESAFCRQNGWVAEWLCSGLQNRGRRFDSDPSLHFRIRSFKLRPQKPGRGAGKRRD